MVLLSLKAGLRAVQIAGLVWGAIREDDTIVDLVSNKGGKPRTVPVNK
jgi:integrase